MSHYPEPLASIQGNVATTKDGHVTLNYILDGFNVSLDMPEASVSKAQRAHDALYKSLAPFGLNFSIYAYKTRTDPQELLNRMYVDGLTQQNLPQYRRDLGAFAEKLRTGEQKEFRRMYMLSVHVPHDISLVGKALSTISEDDESTLIEYGNIAAIESDILKAIPRAFNARRANSDHFLWAYNRSRLRGIEVPVAPTVSSTPQYSYSLNAFPTIMIEKNADGHAIIDGAARLYTTGKDVPRLKETFSRAFRSTELATALAVNNIPDRRGDAPNGTVSYQSFVQVLSAPNRELSPFITFTDIVDWVTTVDADYVQHISYDFGALSKETMRKIRRRVSSENASLSKDDIDEEEFTDVATNIERWRQALREETAPIPMRVATIFCFAHQNLDALESGVRDVIDFFDNQDFKVERIVGAQFDGYCQMLPGIEQSWLTKDIQLSTTSRMYSGSMPIRTSWLGDPTGVPVAINKSNSLGQIVYLNLTTSTDAGNGSIAVTGAQGSGKSHFMKLILGYLADLEKTTYIVDPSPQGEYEVYARSLGQDVTVVNVANGQSSLDPLKIYPYKKAQQQFLDIMLPLLDIKRSSAGASKLANMLTEQYRESHDIRSTRDLLNWLRRAATSDSDMKPVFNALNLYATQPYARVLIDPEDSSGRVIDLPIVDPQTKCVVFRTHGLDSKTTNEKSSMTQMFTQAVMTQIADFSAWRFDQIPDVCVFACDEFAEFKDNKSVTDKMIARTDRMGRKERNWILAGSQLPYHLDENFDLVKKRIILKQEKNDNAQKAFEWVDMTPTPQLIDTMTTDTSPVDPSTNRTERGREGEGWFNDGNGNVCPIKILDHLLPDRSRVADTTSTNMIRA